MDQIEISIPKTRVNEGDYFAVSAFFRDRETAEADAPTTVDYRIDDLTSGIVIRDWTSAAPGESTSIAIVSDDNALQSRRNRTEKRQLTIRANKDLSSQVSRRIKWTVYNQDFVA